MFGNISFILYGVLIEAFPIIVTNAVLLSINIYRLLKIYRTEEDFDLLEFSPEDKIISKFLNFHEHDIKNSFPDFTLDGTEHDVRFVVLRDMVIANIFVAQVAEQGTGVVRINYTVPRYRDYKVGRFIFEREKKYLISKGMTKLVYKKVHNKSHKSFLETMGFTNDDFCGEMCFVKELANVHSPSN
jgi:hypothetical protein